jgi:hypothetical protein
LPTEGQVKLPSTADPLGARAHARAQAGTVAATQPTIPASSAVDLPEGVDPALVLWDERIGGGGYAVRRLPRGSRLRITDLDGDACAGWWSTTPGGPRNGSTWPTP